MRYLPTITQEVLDKAARVDMIADYGTPFIEINGSLIINNPSLEGRRVSKKVTNGIYQMRPSLVACTNRRHLIKSNDLYKIVPRITKDLFVGSTTEATMERLTEVAESFRNGGLSGLTLLVTTKENELYFCSI